MIVKVSAGDYRFVGKLSPQNGNRSLSQAVSTKDNLKSVASFQKHLEKELGMIYSSDGSQQTNTSAVMAGPLEDVTTDSADASAGASKSASSGKADNFNIRVPSSLKGIFEKASEKYGVSEKLLEAIAYHESRFQTNATSSSGAKGVMQLMPSTAKSLGVTNAYDATQNIMGGAKLVSQLLKEFDGDLDLAMAAYSNGSGAVRRAGNKVPDIKQAKDYVAYIDSIFPNGI
jgi:soluble lytic murein transglycosylase-like protein